MGCNDCPLNHLGLQGKVKDTGPAKADIVMVGQEPGETENETGRVFTGPAGKFLDKALASVGLDRKSFLVTNATRCFPGGENYKATTATINACREYLEKVIRKYPRKAIVAFGAVAYQTLTGRTGINKANAIWEYNEEFDCMLLPIIHPSACLHNPGNIPEFMVGIRSLRDFLVGKKVETVDTNVIIIDTHDKLDDLWNVLYGSKIWSFDLETTSTNPYDTDVICFSFSDKPGRGYVLPIMREFKSVWGEHDKLEIAKRLLELFGSYKWRKVAHFGAFDVKVLRNKGMKINGYYWDTLLAHHLINELESHSLKHAAVRYARMPAWSREVDDLFSHIKNNKKIPEEKRNFGSIPPKILEPYAARDADATIRLYKVFSKKLKQLKLDKFMRCIMMPMQRSLINVELRGVRIDTSTVEETNVQQKARLEELKKEIYIMAGREFNIGSPKQLQEILFDELGLQPVKATKTGWSTDESTLKALEHPIIDLILEYRSIVKSNSTYVQRYIGEDIIHTNYHLARAEAERDEDVGGTVTGRLSSSNPNLQNVPKEERKMFVPREGYKFIEADFKQAEVRVQAAVANDPAMLASIRQEDIHAEMCKAVFGIPKEKQTPSDRTRAKAVVFGILYGETPYGLAKNIGVTVGEAEALIENFLGRFPMVRRWQNDTWKTAVRTGIVRNPLGRIRHIPGANSPDKWRREKAKREACNTPIQGGASDLVFVAQLRCEYALAAQGLDAHVVLQTHDELCFEVLEESVPLAKEIIKEMMEAPMPFIHISMPIDMAVTSAWGEEKRQKKG